MLSSLWIAGPFRRDCTDYKMMADVQEGSMGDGKHWQLGIGSLDEMHST